VIAQAPVIRMAPCRPNPSGWRSPLVRLAAFASAVRAAGSRDLYRHEGGIQVSFAQDMTGARRLLG